MHNVKSRDARQAAENAARNTTNLITLAVYDLAALWQRDRDAALVIADASAEAFRVSTGRERQ